MARPSLSPAKPVPRQQHWEGGWLSGAVGGLCSPLSCWSPQNIKAKPTQRYSVCIPGPICHAAGQRWHMGTSPDSDGHHTCCTVRVRGLTALPSFLWQQGRPHRPCECHPLPGTSRLTRFPLPRQVEGGTPGSRDTTATAHAGTAEMALVTSVSGAGPLRGGGAAVPCGPSAPARATGAGCAGEGPCPTGDVCGG